MRKNVLPIEGQVSRSPPVGGVTIEGAAGIPTGAMYQMGMRMPSLYATSPHDGPTSQLVPYP